MISDDLTPHGKADGPAMLPPGTPIVRGGVGMLAQPLLRRPHAARSFRFFDAAILLVNSGKLTLDADQVHMELDEPLTLLAVAQDVRADIQKNPGSGDGTFRSMFLTFAPDVILEFYKRHENEMSISSPIASLRKLGVDADLADTLAYCVRGMAAEQVSDREQRHRLIGLLLALADRGCCFPRPSTQQIGDRLKGLLGPSPQRRWTTATAARELAMSEATLRRRLATENLRFDSLLLDIRMHHAMTLLQTTAWSIPQIAEASGYRASSRFALRFRERFGCSPSRAR
ncbi:helix-turn-helix transcriptional regulator [Paraherbaspirillum soli]|uniref:Helix-turn-helix transcriptional regulator n=1 Tax=Paraherbaspirillum soli TaxID=631222 RepID=A0ABW0M544_9BURK